MKVRPINKKFGKYQIGQAFEFPDKVAAAFIKAGKLEPVPAEAVPVYEAKVMKAEEPAEVTTVPTKRAYRRRDMQAEK